MAANRARTRSPLKPKAVQQKVTPSKKPKAIAPVKQKPKVQIQKATALREAKTRVRVLRSTLVKLRAQVRAERAEGVPDPSVLQMEIARAKSHLEKVQSELSQAKALSRKRKTEIDEWKAWYEKLPEAEKPAGWLSLQNEINWRAAELDSNGQRINGWMMAEIEALGMLEMANQKLAAVEAGVYKLPIEKDPRLKSALNELNKAAAKAAQLTPEKPKTGTGG